MGDERRIAGDAGTWPAYLSVREAAAYLGLSPNTLNAWRREHRGPSFAKLGDSWRAVIRYPITELERFVEGRLVRPHGPGAEAVPDDLPCDPSGGLVDTAEAARVLGTTTADLADLRRQGRGPAYARLGHAPHTIVRYPRAELARLTSDAERTVPDEPSPSPVMSQVEAAAYLGVSPNSLMLWRRQGRAPACSRPNGEHGVLCYERGDLDRFVEEHLVRVDDARAA